MHRSSRDNQFYAYRGNKDESMGSRTRKTARSGGQLAGLSQAQAFSQSLTSLIDDHHLARSVAFSSGSCGGLNSLATNQARMRGILEQNRVEIVKEKEKMVSKSMVKVPYRTEEGRLVHTSRGQVLLQDVPHNHFAWRSANAELIRNIRGLPKLSAVPRLKKPIDKDHPGYKFSAPLIGPDGQIISERPPGLTKDMDVNNPYAIYSKKDKSKKKGKKNKAKLPDHTFGGIATSEVRGLKKVREIASGKRPALLPDGQQSEDVGAMIHASILGEFQGLRDQGLTVLDEAQKCYLAKRDHSEATGSKLPARSFEPDQLKALDAKIMARSQARMADSDRKELADRKLQKQKQQQHKKKGAE